MLTSEAMQRGVAESVLDLIGQTPLLHLSRFAQPPLGGIYAKIEWLIGRIVDKSPTAIRRGKYAMRAIASMSFDQSIAYTESQIALTAMTEDAKEGLAAFGEKRKPAWKGK